MATSKSQVAKQEEPAAAGMGRVELRKWRRRRRVWLTVALALAAVWVSSAWWGFAWLSPGRRWSGGIATGVVGAAHRSPNDTMMVMQGFYTSATPRLRWMPAFERIPFGTRCLVPIWPFVAGAGAMSLRAGVRARCTRCRLAADLCMRCGYELAGAPASSTGVVLCPECGRAVERL